MEGFVQQIVTFPDELKIALAVGVLYLVRLLLAGRVPDENLSEIAAAITTALITVIGILLGLIPVDFEAIATATLRLLAVLLGSVIVINGYLRAREHGLLA